MKQNGSNIFSLCINCFSVLQIDNLKKELKGKEEELKKMGDDLTDLSTNKHLVSRSRFSVVCRNLLSISLDKLLM